MGAILGTIVAPHEKRKSERLSFFAGPSQVKRQKTPEPCSGVAYRQGAHVGAPTSDTRTATGGPCRDG